MEQLANFTDGYPIAAGESINKIGTIAGLFLGFATFPSTVSRPVLWTATNDRIDLVAGTTCDELADPPVPCGSTESGHQVNDANVVTGTYVNGAYRWTAATGLIYLPILGARSPTAINSAGDIVASQFGGSAALLRKSGQLLELPDMWATSINDKREVVGYSGTLPNTSAVIWKRGKGMRPLGTLGGSQSVAYDINSKSEVVGASTNTAGDMRAFYWSATRGMVDLGPGIAYAISDAGHIVGTAPSGLFASDDPENEVWLASLWRGTGGVASTTIASRVGRVHGVRIANCFAEQANWQSKTRMQRCMAGRT